MAKLKGILKIEGTLGDITFYKNKDGEYIAKTKSGVSKKRIEKDPAFARTRENGSEFGNVAHSGKLIRLGSSVLINKAKESTLNNRLVQLLTKVKNLDVVSIRGLRQVAIGLATPEGKAFLKGYDFNSKSVLGAVLHCPYVLDTTTGSVSLTDFMPVDMVQHPTNSTHVTLATGILCLDLTTGIYQMTYSDSVNLKLDMAISSPIMRPNDMPGGDGFKFYFFLIEFFQEVNGVQYALNNGIYNVLNLLEVTD